MATQFSSNEELFLSTSPVLLCSQMPQPISFFATTVNVDYQSSPKISSMCTTLWQMPHDATTLRGAEPGGQTE
jgi:hypothetical protein